jgi:hypothetical protein
MYNLPDKDIPKRRRDASPLHVMERNLLIPCVVNKVVIHIKVAFDDIFSSNSNGSYTPNSPVTFGEVTIEPGLSLVPGVRFSEVDIAQFVGRDLEVAALEDGSMAIRAVY